MSEKLLTRFKKSNYNLAIEYKDIIILYNTLADSISCVKKDCWSGINDIRGDISGDLRLLHQQGILVNEGMDELEVFRFRANRQKYCGKRTHIFLTITSACNCECKYCFAADSFPKRTMQVGDIPLLCQFIENQIKANNSTILNVDFFGGEPFLCEEFYLNAMEAITAIVGKYNIIPEFQFYTNGTIAPSAGFAVFKKFPGTNLLITLDGPRYAHDNLRPMRNGMSSFDRIIANLHAIKDTGVNAKIRINYGLKSHENVEELLILLKKEGLDCFQIDFFPVQQMSEGCADYEDAVPFGRLSEINNKLWNIAMKHNIKLALRPITGNCYCSAFTYSTFIINADMDVFKCALLQCDKKNSIGNLLADTALRRDSSYYEWMNFDPSTQKKCSSCVSLPVCAGGCGGSGTHRFGSHVYPNCYDLSPQLLASRIRLYAEMNYANKIDSFINSDSSFAVLENARYTAP